MAAPQLAQAAQTQLADAEYYVVFEGVNEVEPRVLAASAEPRLSELPAIAKTLDNREEAIKGGLTVQGIRYEVHRHHPPLVYGRTMSEVPEESVGVALCMVEDTPSGKPAYALITYKMPNVSARMVPMLQKFCKENLSTAPPS